LFVQLACCSNTHVCNLDCSIGSRTTYNRILSSVRFNIHTVFHAVCLFSMPLPLLCCVCGLCRGLLTILRISAHFFKLTLSLALCYNIHNKVHTCVCLTVVLHNSVRTSSCVTEDQNRDFPRLLYSTHDLTLGRVLFWIAFQCPVQVPTRTENENCKAVNGSVLTQAHKSSQRNNAE